MREYMQVDNFAKGYESENFCTFYTQMHKTFDLSYTGRITFRNTEAEIRISPAEKTQRLESKLLFQIEEREVPECIDDIVDIS